MTDGRTPSFGLNVAFPSLLGFPFNLRRNKPEPIFFLVLEEDCTSCTELATNPLTSASALVDASEPVQTDSRPFPGKFLFEGVLNFGVFSHLFLSAFL